MPPPEVVKAALVVGAVPAPPLPMLVCKEVPDELSYVDGDEVITVIFPPYEICTHLIERHICNIMS
jgi:hypothetical protein